MSEQYSNGRITRSQFFEDFGHVRSDTAYTRRKVENIEQKTSNLTHLEKLPDIASSMKMLARVSLLRDITILVIVLVIIIKGSNLHIKTPWFEINGNNNEAGK
jgi:hypothetical protein